MDLTDIPFYGIDIGLIIHLTDKSHFTGITRITFVIFEQIGFNAMRDKPYIASVSFPIILFVIIHEITDISLSHPIVLVTQQSFRFDIINPLVELKS